MLKLLNRVSPDSTPDAYGSGIDSEGAILMIICIVLFMIIVIGGISICYYIQSLKERIKDLEEKKQTREKENTENDLQKE